MRIDIISVVPELLQSPLQHSIMQRAQEKGLLEVVVHNLRDYGLGNYRQIDDYQYGGGAGMVMMIEPVAKCMDTLMAERKYDEVIYLTPDGQRLEQPIANQLSLKGNLMMLCGHYKGVDERIREHYITMEISIGDFVLSGGELPAAILVDSIGRLLPGVLGDETSALFDSFQDNLLAPPVYTRPANYNGWKVPDILLSGHEARIEDWRYEKALERTQTRRPDLLERDD
ncbi:MAG: tRNA (guanosine(37)-N1)-methyltransferase TrmD [Saprospiraceae bacterium]|jgi:tRNA (guanine37-N1)-methyltransferase|nr:tRNA (guanosine(37)-N1)-methyltransferase TrmD [Saprospiraceae bacterium]